MSTIETKIVKAKIFPHSNADRLEMAQLFGDGGFECVVGKGQFLNGDLVIYIMPDSILNEEMCTILAERSKIQIKDGRIRAIKVRGILSEGLCLDPKEWLDHEVKEGDDVSEELRITKFEPPPKRMQSVARSGKGINFNYENENFKKYYCVEKFKKSPKILAELNQDVVATIKYHGMNWRGGWVTKPVYKKTWWNKLINLFIKEEPKEFLIGSHNKIKIQTKNSIKYGDYYNTDAWWRIAKKYNIETIVKQISEQESLISYGQKEPPNVIIYAEVVGPGCQKNYCYGVERGELEIRVFDIMINGKYSDWDKVVHLCKCFDLPIAEEVYSGPWSLDVVKYASGKDEYNGKKHIREGIVIRPLIESWHPKCGRVIFKYLNETYLLNKNNTEHH